MLFDRKCSIIKQGRMIYNISKYELMIGFVIALKALWQTWSLTDQVKYLH